VVRSLAVLVFIGAAAAAGIYVGTRKTVIKGDVMAENMMEQVKDKGVTKITCDERIPVTTEGAVFRCQLHASDGSTALFEYKMDRAGALSASLLDSTLPTRGEP